MQLGVGWPARFGGDLAGGAAGVVGEHRHPQLTGGVDLLAVDRRPAGRHARLQLLEGHPHGRQVRRSRSARCCWETNGSSADTDLGGERLQSIPGTWNPPATIRSPVRGSSLVM